MVAVLAVVAMCVCAATVFSTGLTLMNSLLVTTAAVAEQRGT